MQGPHDIDAKFTRMEIDVADSQESQILSVLPKAIGFIEKALSAGGTVLVHCWAGVSRRSAVQQGVCQFSIIS